MDMKSLKKQQIEIAKKAVLRDGFKKIRSVAGFDLAFSGNRVFCSGVVMEWDGLEMLESKTVSGVERFPYIPGFLAFREASHIIRVYKKLSQRPDVLLIDGQGICHPRRVGIASHVGVLLNIPTVGVAKSRLCGDYKEPDSGIGKLFLEGKHIGWVLKKKGKPIFVSPGHKVSVNSCLEIVSHCIKDDRLPEPLRLAHLYAAETKNKYENR